MILKKWSLIIHISLFLIFGMLMFFQAFETLDYRLQDNLYQQRETVDSEIVIIGIDDDSLGVLGRWPWPRDYHGELIRIIEEGDPAVIGYDVIFAEESAIPGEDDYLIQVVEASDNVVFPMYGTFSPAAERGRIQALNLTRPFPALDEVSKAGHINTLMDNDGIVRRTVLNFDFQGEKINSFAWEIYKICEEKTSRGGGDVSKRLELSTAPPQLIMEDIPRDEWERTHIRYTGEPFDFEYIPFYMVITGEIPPEYFREKIVLVGPTAIGVADDYYFTPMAPQVPMYGVEIHGNIIQQFMYRKFWQEVSFIGQLGIMLAMGSAGYFLFRRFKPGIGALVLAGFAGIFLVTVKFAASGSATSGYADFSPGYVMSFVYPLGLIGIQYIAILAEKFIAEQLEKKRVTDVFGKYVAPQIVDKILEEGEQGLQLGGARREITVLFVDIRGFTPLSESAEPEEVVSILNDYLTLCAKSIFAYGGTLDKYIGDAAMALYNAPLDLENHQLRAVQTAWAMHEGAQPLQEELERRFGKTVRFGVGIHTGPAIVGNVGADFRMDYTAIGDTVNTAARIESNSKPGQILISQAVYDKVRDYVEVTDLGPIQVKGKAQGVQVYQVNRCRGGGDVSF